MQLLGKTVSKGLSSTKIEFDAVRGARQERFVPVCSVFMFTAPTPQWRLITKQSSEADGTRSAIKIGIWGFLLHQNNKLFVKPHTDTQYFAGWILVAVESTHFS